jgi:succinyl-CoA synthetase beta subunit
MLQRQNPAGVDSPVRLCLRLSQFPYLRPKGLPSHEHPRISGQGTARQVRRPRPRRLCRLSVEEAVEASKKLPGPLYVVKAQIHAGGRGKGKFKELPPDAKGGVRLAKTEDEVRAARDRHARQHAGDDPDRRAWQAGQPPLRHRRRRHRQGILPRPARQSRHRPQIDGRLDRGRHGHRDRRARHAREDPQRSTSIPRPASCRITAAPLPLRSSSRAISPSRPPTGSKLYDAFLGTDAEQIEINPLAVTDDGKLLVLDAKVAFDGNAMFRHKDLLELRDETEEDPPSSKRRSTTSPTSSSTATSAAWSTAPAWRWRRWTSSS